jgi:hypothetical protein
MRSNVARDLERFEKNHFTALTQAICAFCVKYLGMDVQFENFRKYSADDLQRAADVTTLTVDGHLRFALRGREYRYYQSSFQGVSAKDEFTIRYLRYRNVNGIWQPAPDILTEIHKLRMPDSADFGLYYFLTQDGRSIEQLHFFDMNVWRAYDSVNQPSYQPAYGDWSWPQVRENKNPHDSDLAVYRIADVEGFGRTMGERFIRHRFNRSDGKLLYRDANGDVYKDRYGRLRLRAYVH